MHLPIHSFEVQGVPVYFEQYPDFFKPMAISLVMFSGGADDFALGAPGIHHWGEHIPFRGTVGFPNGSSQIDARLAELGGYINAYTSEQETIYHAKGPVSDWKEVAEIVIDLAARPLLRPSDIEAERNIIDQEINESNSSFDRQWMRLLVDSVWGTHPMGTSIIGTKEDLARCDIEAIAHMRSKSYGKNRAVVLMSGSMGMQEVQDHLNVMLERLPNNPITVRRVQGSHGQAPEWIGGDDRVRNTHFDSTFVALAFPIPDLQLNVNAHQLYRALNELFQEGGLSSPLLRIVREERQLVYSTFAFQQVARDGGFFALSANTSADRVDDVVRAFWDVINDKDLRSPERWEYLLKVKKAQQVMSIPNPDHTMGEMLGELTSHGQVRTIEERRRATLVVPHELVLKNLEQFTPERARVITLLGR